jgi:curved DNA-binding protein CbpA
METLKQIIGRLGGDPFEILATAPDADFAVLRKNYRTLALKYHPDRNKEEAATERFIKINRAYEFLEEESNRRLYADHIRALEEQRQRVQAMDAERRNLIEDLKRREEDHVRTREDMQAEARRRKEFFERKEREEEERE